MASREGEGVKPNDYIRLQGRSLKNLTRQIMSYQIWNKKGAQSKKKTHNCAIKAFLTNFGSSNPSLTFTELHDNYEL